MNYQKKGLSCSVNKHHACCSVCQIDIRFESVPETVKKDFRTAIMSVFESGKVSSKNCSALYLNNFCEGLDESFFEKFKAAGKEEKATLIMEKIGTHPKFTVES